MQNNINDKVYYFIVQQFLFGEAGNLSYETALYENDIIDSTGILEIIQFIEVEFKIQIADDEITYENFNTIADIACLVSQKDNQTN